MNPYYQNDFVTIYRGDCRELSFGNISAVVTDPPYELGFMGKAWDSKGVSFQKETWGYLRKQCLSGAPLLSFGGTRTFHRIACAIEDAGWEIRDCLMWMYGSGFPKSLDVSKAIDYGACREQLTEKLGRKPTKDELKEAWARFREVIGYEEPFGRENRKVDGYNSEVVFGKGVGIKAGKQPIRESTTPEAQLWEGYGTALKPAYEPIILGMNPLDGTFAENALKHKVAGLNIDGCRVGTEKPPAKNTPFESWRNLEGREDRQSPEQTYNSNQGRFPSNFIHDGSQMVMELFPETHGAGNIRKSWVAKAPEGWGFGPQYKNPNYHNNHGGSAARFFKKCKIDLSDLCFSLGYDTMNTWKIIYVHTAERLLEITQGIIENTAQLNVVGLQSEENDPLVKSAVSHADLCEILTALVLVKIKTLASNPEILQAIRDYTSNSKECTQLLNLVSSAEIQVSTDITQITTSLLTSFGYANPAIINSIPEIERLEPRRFLYTPKASKAERDRGLEDIPEQASSSMPGRRDPYNAEWDTGNDVTTRFVTMKRNNHPTVKPLALMEYLVKLVKMPENNLILDPFMGSGTTLLACIKLGIPCIGIDSDEHTCEIAAKRCEVISIHGQP